MKYFIDDLLEYQGDVFDGWGVFEESTGKCVATFCDKDKAKEWINGLNQMSKTIVQPISIEEKVKEVAQKKSKELYGRVNLSGYISYLIRNDNKKALK